MSQTISQAQELVRKVCSAGLKLQVGVQGMSDESYEVANDYVGQGRLGKVVMAQINFTKRAAAVRGKPVLSELSCRYGRIPAASI